MNNRSGEHVHNFSSNYISPPILHKDDGYVIVRTTRLPRIRDIWILHCVAFSNHFIQFFIPRIEALFQAGDKLVKVETPGLTSHIVSWRLCEDNNRQFQWQLNSTNEQTFSINYQLHF